MSGRNREPSTTLPSGSASDRSSIFSSPEVGNIFYNTDTSNVEIYHQDPSNNAAWRDLVVNNRNGTDISGVSKVTFSDNTEMMTTPKVSGLSYSNNTIILSQTTGSNEMTQVIPSRIQDDTTFINVNVPAIQPASSTIDVVVDGTTSGQFKENSLEIPEIRAKDSNGLKLYNDAGNDGIFVADNGQVGIGDTTPSEKLDVSGNINATNLNASGNINATNLNATGDVTLNSRSLWQVGEISIFAGATIPNGWLECNGAAISRTAYSDLFAVIGTIYGYTNSTTFKVPDMRERFIRGSVSINSLGNYNNQAWKSLRISSHYAGSGYTHDRTYNANTSYNYNGSSNNVFTGKWQTPGTRIQLQWGTQEMYPKHILFNICIKY